MRELFTFPTDTLLSDEREYLTIAINREEDGFTADKKQTKFDNLVKKGYRLIEEKHGKEVAEAYTEQLSTDFVNPSFWRSVKSSIIFFVTPDEVFYYNLSVDLTENAYFGQPHVKPVVRNFQYVSYYHILCLSHDKVRLFNGRGSELEEVDFPDDAPIDIDTALGTEYSGGELNHGSYGDGGDAVYHGHNEKSKEDEIDRKRFFRVIDDYIHENYTAPTGLPLVLFGLTQNIADFREISKNPKLDQETQIESSPRRLKATEVAEKAGDIVEEIISKRYNQLVQTFEETSPEYSLGEQYQDLATASVEGRIDTLLITDHYQVDGSIDESGQFQAEGKNFVDDLIIHVLRTKGDVYVLADEEMPADTHIAALLRY